MQRCAKPSEVYSVARDSVTILRKTGNKYSLSCALRLHSFLLALKLQRIKSITYRNRITNESINSNWSYTDTAISVAIRQKVL